MAATSAPEEPAADEARRRTLRSPGTWSPSRLNLLVILGSCLLFLANALYQLDLPGLYPDEAFDVIPTMQLMLGHPVELQRNAAIHMFGLSLPLMSSSDYQGITSTYLALPFFAIGGINVYSLRVMTVLVGVVAIVLAFFLARAWFNDAAARLAVILLAVSPSWIFWSRIGVYVVSEVVPLAAGALLAFTIWTRRRPAGTRNGPLYAGMFLLGLGLTTKLLFIWLIIAVALTGLILYGRTIWDARHAWFADLRRWGAVALAASGAFCLGAFPFLLYNAMTRGTLYVLRANAGSTTHGVNNSAVLRNLWTEADALRVLLDGSYFWFQGVLGKVYYNPLTPGIFALSAIGLVAVVLSARQSGARISFRGVALPGSVLAASILVALGMAVLQPAGAVGNALIVVSIAAGAVGAVWLAVVALGKQEQLTAGSWALLGASVLAGAAWWFGGAGRPEGPDPHGIFGLWPVDAAGAIFWASGAALVFVMGFDARPVRYQRIVTAILAITGLVVAQSAVTVSGLWSTHLLLLIPLPEIVIAAFFVQGLAWVRDRFSFPERAGRAFTVTALVAGLVVGGLLTIDQEVDYAYHRDLALTGGGSTFSDAIYGLSDWLVAQDPKRVVALDWGFKRPIQFLTLEKVNPLDAYGYTPEVTAEFRSGLRDLMSQPDTIYLFHTPDGTAYPRFDAFKEVAAQLGKSPELVKTFYHRDGVPVYLVYRVR